MKLAKQRILWGYALGYLAFPSFDGMTGPGWTSQLNRFRSGDSRGQLSARVAAAELFAGSAFPFARPGL